VVGVCYGVIVLVESVYECGLDFWVVFDDEDGCYVGMLLLRGFVCVVVMLGVMLCS